MSEVAGETSAPRLRDGIRDCVLVFLGVRVGLSVLSLISVGLIEPRETCPPCRGGRSAR